MTRPFHGISTLYTIEPSIRNVAFSHHSLWVEQANKNIREGFECAIYYEPYANLVYPDTLDAMMVEITAGQTGYHISGFAVIPDGEREEIKINIWYSNYAKAKQAADRWIIATRKLVMLHNK
ncbi:hypothetical protein KIAC18_001052 [Sporomusa sphaeroides]|uniref:hypothetical protein n=1 Tax=Sporomusa sphaeroides TaxID=47679 RepID=UPI003DA1C418